MTPDERDQWKNLLTTRWGRDLVWRMIQSCGVFSVDFEADPVIISRKNGARNQMLLWMKEMQQAAPGSYATMLKENIEDEQR